MLFTFLAPVSGQVSDSTRKEIRREQRKERRLAFKQNRERTLIAGNFLYATLSTTVNFQLGEGILNVRLGLEDNFGLKKEQFFFSGSLIHRFTPKSGLSTNYYGLTRFLTRVTDQEYIFLKDTIPAGTVARAFFTTNVLSLGYLYTLFENERIFFAGYFNLYIMDVRTGVKSEGFRVNAEADITAPLPNFGVIGAFRLKPWLELDCGLGYFALSTPGFGGRLSNLLAKFNFTVWKWFSVSIGYERFELRANFQEENVNTLIEYDFRGPSLGVKLSF